MVYTKVIWDAWTLNSDAIEQTLAPAREIFLANINQSYQDTLVSTDHDTATDRWTTIRKWQSSEHAQGWLDVIATVDPSLVHSSTLLTNLE